MIFGRKLSTNSEMSKRVGSQDGTDWGCCAWTHPPDMERVGMLVPWQQVQWTSRDEAPSQRLSPLCVNPPALCRLSPLPPPLYPFIPLVTEQTPARSVRTGVCARSRSHARFQFSFVIMHSVCGGWGWGWGVVMMTVMI